MTEPATTATEAETAVAPLRERNPTTDTMIDIGTAVLAGLRAYPTLPPIIGFSITTELSASVRLCPGQSFSLHAARNVAVWARELDLYLALYRGATAELVAKTTLAGHPVRIQTYLYDSRRDELVDRLVANCPDMLAVPQSWKVIDPTPAQVIAALAGHPDVPELAP